jgi:coenzyme Q-binding protein COQ10
MPSFRTNRTVRHGPDAMLALVADVERYPEFVPLCERLVVRSRETDEDGRQIIVAAMTAGYGPIHETFTSRVTIDRAERRIVVSYLDGPFRRLENTWDFEPVGEGCRIAFYISYEFRSLPLQMLMGAMFDKAFRKFAEAFERRADSVYGSGLAPA